VFLLITLLEQVEQLERAIRRLRDALGDMNPQKVAEMKRQLIAFTAKPVMAKAAVAAKAQAAAARPAQVAEVVAMLPYKVKRPTPAKAALKMPRRREAVAAAR